MAPNAPTRILLVALLVSLAGCGKKPEVQEQVDLAAIRARRDSIQRVAVRDSLDRVRFGTCSDSVLAAVAKASKKKKGAKPAPTPEGMIPPEVLTACGKPPVGMPIQVASADTDQEAGTGQGGYRRQGGPAGGAGRDSGDCEEGHGQGGGSGQAGADRQTAASARADSIRQARERAKQDSLQKVAERAREDSIVKSQRDSVKAESLKVARETEVLRETFTYAGGARDPFASLITEDKVGPEFNDLLLVGVYLDLRRASNSVVVLRDKTNQKRYKLRVGDRLGRLKVAQIRQTDVVFTVEDIGFERQETLSLRKREEQTP